MQPYARTGTGTKPTSEVGYPTNYDRYLPPGGAYNPYGGQIGGNMIPSPMGKPTGQLTLGGGTTNPPPVGPPVKPPTGFELPGDAYRKPGTFGGDLNPYAAPPINPNLPVWDVIFDQMGFQRPTSGYQFLTPPPPPPVNPGLTVAQPRPQRPLIDPVYQKMNKGA